MAIKCKKKWAKRLQRYFGSTTTALSEPWQVIDDTKTLLLIESSALWIWVDWRAWKCGLGKNQE